MAKFVRVEEERGRGPRWENGIAKAGLMRRWNQRNPYGGFFAERLGVQGAWGRPSGCDLASVSPCGAREAGEAAEFLLCRARKGRLRGERTLVMRGLKCGRMHDIHHIETT